MLWCVNRRINYGLVTDCYYFHRRGTDGVSAGIIDGTHDYCSESVRCASGRPLRACLHLYHPVWRHLVGRMWQRLKHKFYFYWLLIVGVIPAVVIGLLAKKSGLLDWLLDSVEVVAVMLVVGGVFMLYCDKLFNKGSEDNKVDERRAFKIGLYQCISVIPGVSRSMATIVGGMTQGLTRRRAAKFSFFLAVPTMAGATLLDLLDLMKEDTAWATSHNITMLILGCVIAFIVALLAMKWFVNFLSKYGFKAFGIYRIVVGGIIILLLLTGHSLAMVD